MGEVVKVAVAGAPSTAGVANTITFARMVEVTISGEHKEPEIIVNGRTLTFEEVMAISLAVTLGLAQMLEWRRKGLNDDGAGHLKPLEAVNDQIWCCNCERCYPPPSRREAP